MRLRGSLVSSADEWSDLFGEWGNGSDGEPLPLTVETYQGSGMKAAKYGNPVDHPGLVQFPQNRLVRNTDNNEQLSTAAVFAPLELRAEFVPHSRVTLADGRVATVIALQVADIGELFGFIRVDVE